MMMMMMIVDKGLRWRRFIACSCYAGYAAEIKHELTKILICQRPPLHIYSGRVNPVHV